MWIILGIILSVLVLIYWKLKQPHYHWIKLGVKQEDPTFFVGNNAGAFFKTSPFADVIQRMYNSHPNERYIGIYMFFKPTLLIRDLDLIKQLLVKEFDSFPDHTQLIPPGIDELWTKSVFASTGEKWRDLRSTISPAFTTNKMRGMFLLMSDCAQQFTQFFLDKDEDLITLEMEDTFTRFASDCIGTCAFGLKCDSLNEPDNEFYLAGKEATDFTSLSRTLGMFCYIILPRLMKALGVGMFTKRIRKYFRNLVLDTIKIREERNIIRPDIIYLLTEARKGRLQYVEDDKSAKETGFATAEEADFKRIVKAKKMEITDSDIVAQAMGFFFAGFETTSLTLCMTAYELAVNHDVQDRLLKEIDNHLKETNGNITYEGINKLKYLDMVLSEVIRKWPPIPATDRVCMKPFTIEPTLPNEKPLEIPAGTSCWIPIYGLQRDPNYYPNPDKFDPERFSDENKSEVNPYTYLTFGAGPRNCLGSRFALMEAKTVYVYILRHFKFVPVERTDIPFIIGKAQMNIHAKNGNWLGLQRRK